MMVLQNSVQHVVGQLCTLLHQLSCRQYAQPLSVLNGASIGQHVRHVAELFQCLLAGYENGVINYDNRNRDITIETDRLVAHDVLLKMAGGLGLQNRRLLLQSFSNELHHDELTVETNFYREVVYNLEHTIHHMALIRIGVQNVSNIRLEDSFGVAPSTIQYRKACVQ